MISDILDDVVGLPAPKPKKNARLENKTSITVKYPTGGRNYIGLEMDRKPRILITFEGPNTYEGFGSLKLEQVKELITLLQGWVATQ